MISSKETINELKRNFYGDMLPKIKAKEAYLTKDINDNSNNLLVVNSDKGLKLGPLITNFEPSKCYGKEYEQIVQDMVLTINPYSFDTKNKRLIETIQQTALSTKPIQIETQLDKKPNFIPDFDKINNPVGFKGKLEKMQIVENPVIPLNVDDVLEDKLKATESIKYIYEYGFDSYYLTKLISSGLLGLEKRFVSTRQSITAIDDTIGKILLESIRTYTPNQKYLLFTNSFLHNHYFIFLLPGNFEFEQYEIWPLGNVWNSEYDFNHEYEPFYGRKGYADKQAGGYYASRLSILEYLKTKRIQARVIVFRVIEALYSIPVGVWQVRENVAHAFDKPTKEFQNEQEIKDFVKQNVKGNTEQMIKESHIFGQKKLFNFFQTHLTN